MDLKKYKGKIMRILGLLFLLCVCAVLFGFAQNTGEAKTSDYEIFNPNMTRDADKDQQMREQMVLRLENAINEMDGVESAEIQLADQQKQLTVQAAVTLSAGSIFTEEQRAGIEGLIENSTGSTSIVLLIE